MEIYPLGFEVVCSLSRLESLPPFIFLDFLAISWSLSRDVASTYRQGETMRIDEATA
jgi:hypothetical protein